MGFESELQSIFQSVYEKEASRLTSTYLPEFGKIANENINNPFYLKQTQQHFPDYPEELAPLLHALLTWLLEMTARENALKLYSDAGLDKNSTDIKNELQQKKQQLAQQYPECFSLN